MKPITSQELDHALNFSRASVKARAIFHTVFKFAVWLLLIPFLFCFLPAPGWAATEYQEQQYQQTSLPIALEGHAKIQAIAAGCQMPMCNHIGLVIAIQAQLAQEVAFWTSRGDEYEVRFQHAMLDGIN